MHASVDTVRVFFALWPNEPERSALAAWQKDLPGTHVMRADTLHATLVFLGELEENRLEALALAASEVSAGHFELCLDEARYWGHNHIVYAAPGVPPPPLIDLVVQLEKSLARHHFLFDRREYKPHVTLMRNAHWTDDPLPKMSPVSWSVEDFVLLQSCPEGGYRVLYRFLLSR